VATLPTHAFKTFTVARKHAGRRNRRRFRRVGSTVASILQTADIRRTSGRRVRNPLNDMVSPIKVCRDAKRQTWVCSYLGHGSSDLHFGFASVRNSYLIVISRRVQWDNRSLS
jgi:hypothetical protein